MEKSFGLMFFQKKTRSYQPGGPVVIYFRITVNEEPREISCKCTCTLNLWNASTGRMNGRTEEAKSTNRYLDAIQQKVYTSKTKLMEMGLVFDEFPTIYLNNMDGLIATARSNKVATTLRVQDLSQLRKDYGKEQADVIMNITGNIISGQVTGDTAKQLSERFGKIMQDRTSLSINRTDTSISRSKQLDSAIPASKIAGLSSGEFVGMVSDDPTQKIELKTFHNGIQNDHKFLALEERGYSTVPIEREVTPSTIRLNFEQIQNDVEDIVNLQMELILSDPALTGVLIKKKGA